MDPLSAAASVIAVLQLTQAVVQVCGKYIKEVKHAQEEIASLQREVTSLTSVLEKLFELLNSPDDKTLSTSLALAQDANHCLSVLASLQEKIDPGKQNVSRRQKAMRILSRQKLEWPLKREEVDKAIKDLERYKSSFTLALQIDQMKLLAKTSGNSSSNSDTYLEKLPVAQGAEFNSYANQHEDECLPETRTTLRQQIAEWAEAPQSKCLFWLNGMAGTGKSTISRTMARFFHEKGVLAASFFFKRGEADRGNASRLFATITRQLIDMNPDIKPGVVKSIQADPAISTRPLRDQFEKLIFEPLLGLEAADGGQAQTMVIVIDALDECENDSDIQDIIECLARLGEPKAVRVRTFVTSRPEVATRFGFKDVGENHQDLILHRIPHDIIAHDISLFLRHRLAAIRKTRSLPSDWPSEEDLQTLIDMSVPLFIFAATICRMFEDHYLDPVQCLEEVLEYQNEESKLDAIYLPVLNRLLLKYSGKRQKQLVEEVRDVLGIIILLRSPLSVVALSKLMGVSTRSINIKLNSLHSVLNIPDNEMLPVRLFHLSFHEFLLDPETRDKTPFWVDEGSVQQKLAAQCLAAMGQLKRNICNLPSYGIKHRDITAQAINDHVPPELHYACRYWTHHLVRSQDPAAQLDKVFEFLQDHFLHWVEVMSLLGIVSEVVGAINTLHVLVQDNPNESICEFLDDAKRFILKNRQIADTHPLQVYASGLVFAPKRAIIRKEFEREIPTWMHRCPRVEETWSSEIQTLEGHTHWVASLVFTSDGRLLASGSDDCSIKLWDPTTGDLKQTLNDHSESVVCIALSPDEKILASASFDQTVKLWDLSTGDLKQTLYDHSDAIRSVTWLNDELIVTGSNNHSLKTWNVVTGEEERTLEGHEGPVASVAYSAQKQLLASASHDETIKLWDPIHGELKRTLRGHTDSVRSVAFSPDGRLLASSAYDKTVKIWDPVTGDLQKTLTGHTNWVRTVTFSWDGKLLASGSDDYTIKLWDPPTGELKQTLKGHSSFVRSTVFSPDGRILASGSNDRSIRLWYPTPTDATLNSVDHHTKTVRCVSFSPDNQLVASGSYDHTVKLWNATTGDLKHTMTCHSDTISSVAFSPDGQLLASSSHDKTIRLWNLHGELQHTFQGHSETIGSISFSPDGQLLASGSYDKTVKLWSLAGDLKYTLEGHADWVQSIAFSPDGKLLASSSDDQVVNLWDPQTGDLIHALHSEEGAVADLRFSRTSPHLITDQGIFDIHSWYDGFSALGSSPDGHDESAIAIQDGQWVIVDGAETLWLPPEWRPGCFATGGSTLALGCKDGRVAILEFGSCEV
ncbi:NACHT and WD40 domain protein [Aspergillus falconensis]